MWRRRRKRRWRSNDGQATHECRSVVTTRCRAALPEEATDRSQWEHTWVFGGCGGERVLFVGTPSNNPRTQCIHCDNQLVIKRKCVLSFSLISLRIYPPGRWHLLVPITLIPPRRRLYTHMRAHMHTHTRIHTQTHIQMHLSIHLVFAHTHTHVCVLTRALPHKQAHPHTHIHLRTTHTCERGGSGYVYGGSDREALWQGGGSE